MVQIVVFGLALEQRFQMLTFGQRLVVTPLELANDLVFLLNSGLYPVIYMCEGSKVLK